MSFGGFLGMGESYHPLPWRVLTYDTRRGGFVVDLDSSQLKKAPTYTASNIAELVRPDLWQPYRPVLWDDALLGHDLIAGQDSGRPGAVSSVALAVLPS